MNSCARQIAMEIWAIERSNTFKDLESRTIWEELGFSEKTDDVRGKQDYDKKLVDYGWWWLVIGTIAAYINDDGTADREFVKSQLLIQHPYGIDVVQERAVEIANSIIGSWFRSSDVAENLMKATSSREYLNEWNRRFDYAYGCGRTWEQLRKEIDAHAAVYKKCTTKVEKAKIFAEKMKPYKELVQKFMGEVPGNFFTKEPELPKSKKELEDKK